MKILMKIYEYRCYPMGDVYEVEVNSLRELQTLHYSYTCEDGKRSGTVCFKKEIDDKWLAFEYFKYDLQLPKIKYDDLIRVGLEDEYGIFKSEQEEYEEWRKRTEIERREIKKQYELEAKEFDEKIKERLKEFDDNGMPKFDQDDGMPEF
jgi:hypothetical protein